MSKQTVHCCAILCSNWKIWRDNGVQRLPSDRWRQRQEWGKLRCRVKNRNSPFVFGLLFFTIPITFLPLLSVTSLSYFLPSIPISLCFLLNSHYRPIDFAILFFVISVTFLLLPFLPFLNTIAIPFFPQSPSTSSFFFFLFSLLFLHRCHSFFSWSPSLSSTSLCHSFSTASPPPLFEIYLIPALSFRLTIAPFSLSPFFLKCTVIFYNRLFSSFLIFIVSFWQHFVIKNSPTIILPQWNKIIENCADLSVRKMPQDVSTWWNSTYDMLKFALTYSDPINQITGDRSMKLRQYELTNLEWTIVEQLQDCPKVRHLLLFFWDKWTDFNSHLVDIYSCFLSYTELLKIKSVMFV